MTPLNRRSLITGLISFVAAPAIVRAGSLMPVSNFNPYYERYLAAYCINTDETLLRVDRALFPLKIPLRGATVVTKQFAEQFIPRETINTMRPVIGQQLCMDIALPYNLIYSQDMKIVNVP